MWLLVIHLIRHQLIKYGIELMEDNVEMLVMNMSNAFQQIYYHTFDLQDQDIR